MAEISRPWAGTTIGDAGPYTAPNWWDVWQAMMGSNGALIGAGNKGIFPAIGDAFVLTYPGPNFLTVGTGAAMVDGLFYRNDAAKSVTVTSATAGNVRDDRLVIRKYFAADNQTARIVLLPGSEVASPGPGTPPALTQDVNRLTYWDIPLSRVSIADTGVITLTDEREYIPSPISGMVLLRETRITDPAGGTVTWDNIPQGYADLIVSYSAQATNSASFSDVDVQFNDDADANHYAHGSDYYKWCDPAIMSFEHNTGSSAYLALGQVTTSVIGNTKYMGVGEFTIPGYSEATSHVGFGRAAAPTYDAYESKVAWWKPDTLVGITKIYMQSGSNSGSGNYNFVQGSVFRLYARTR